MCTCPNHTSFANYEEIEHYYYPESIKLLKQLTGASHIALFNHSEFCPNMHRPPVTVCIASAQPSAAGTLERVRSRSYYRGLTVSLRRRAG